jgi:hypothetical protein
VISQDWPSTTVDDSSPRSHARGSAAGFHHSSAAVVEAAAPPLAELAVGIGWATDVAPRKRNRPRHDRQPGIGCSRKPSSAGPEAWREPERRAHGRATRTCRICVSCR